MLPETASLFSPAPALWTERHPRLTSPDLPPWGPVPQFRGSFSSSSLRGGRRGLGCEDSGFPLPFSSLPLDLTPPLPLSPLCFMWSPRPSSQVAGTEGVFSPCHPPHPPSPVMHVRPAPGSQEPTTPVGSLAPNPLRHWEELVHSVLPVSLETVRLEGEVNALIGGQLSVGYLEGVCVPEARTHGAATNGSTCGQLPSCPVQGPGTYPWV